MSGYPPGFESLEAQFAEIARRVMEAARQERVQASPWAYGDKINLGQSGGFVGALPSALGGATGTRWVPLTNGDPAAPGLIFDALGQVIVVEESI